MTGTFNILPRPNSTREIKATEKILLVIPSAIPASERTMSQWHIAHLMPHALSSVIPAALTNLGIDADGCLVPVLIQIEAAQRENTPCGTATKLASSGLGQNVACRTTY